VTAPRRILLVAQISPPSSMVAARRIGGLAKELGRLGHEVTVLTSVVSGTGPVEGAARTIRTRDLIASRINWRRANFESLAGAASTAYDPAPSVFASIIVPDLEVVGWVPFALPHALRLARAGSVDCVVTSSPPHSGHLIGMALRSRGVAWVADLRDGWRFDPSRPRYPLRVQRALDAALERRMARTADVAVGVTRPIAEDLAARLDARATTITNGFDPDAHARTEIPRGGDGGSLLRPGRHSLVHTGTVGYAGRGRSFEPLVEALRRLRRTRPDVAERLELVFAGPAAAHERRLLEDPDVAGTVTLAGALPHPDALALQRAADSLLVVAGERHRSVATGKLYEYLAAGRPILVLGAHSAAADIVAEAGAGIAVAADDPDAIAVALARLVAPPPDAAVAGAAAEAIERFGYPAIARRFAAEIDRAIDRSAHGGAR
jgi:glycosyltransferase involved in cell wall biosynthesis